MMNATNGEPRREPVDPKLFEKAIRDNLTPEGVAAVIAFLQPAVSRRATTDEQRRALLQVEWLVDTLLELLGTDEYNHLLDELSL